MSGGGGSVPIVFKAETQQATAGIDKLALSVQAVEQKTERVAKKFRESGTAARQAGDAGAEGMKKMGAEAARTEEKLQMVIAAAAAALRAMQALTDHARKTANMTQAAGQSFMATMAATGDTGISGLVEDRMKQAMKQYGVSQEQYQATYQTVRQALPERGARAGWQAADAFVRGADALKVSDQDAAKLAESAATLMRLDPKLSPESAYGMSSSLFMRGADPSHIAGLSERLGSSPEKTTAMALQTIAAGQDVGILDRIAAKIGEEQQSGGKMVTLPDGRKIRSGGASYLFDATGAPRPVGDVLAEGLSGQIPGFAETYSEGRSRAALGAIMKRGGFAGFLDQARGASGVIPALEAAQNRAGGSFASGARSEERMQTMEQQIKLARYEQGAKELPAIERERRMELEAARTGVAMDALVSNPITGAAIRTGSYLNAGKVTEPQFRMGIAARDAVSRAEANYARDALPYGGTRVRSTAPANTQVSVDVNIIKTPESGSADAN